MFNPRPRIESIAITPRERCWIIDDALVEPERWVAYAQENADAFAEAGHNAYPGPELRLPEAFAQGLSAFFTLHLRERLGARRVQRVTARLALTTRPPRLLQPRQSICHVDRMQAARSQCIGATVLYLFADPALGGTSFFAPRRPPADLAQLLADSATMDAATFEHRHGIAPGYMTDSNPWFERLATVPARFNRLIAYNGAIFHSGDIRQPGRLTTDIATGRLSANGFFVCSRPLTA